jgi:hypothetical protein
VANPVSKIGWKVIGGVAATVAGSLAGKAVTSAYVKIRKSDPPADPRHPDTSWTDALGWAVMSGVAIGVGRLVAQRLVARTWVRATGSLPPGMKEHVDS